MVQCGEILCFVQEWCYADLICCSVWCSVLWCDAVRNDRVKFGVVSCDDQMWWCGEDGEV